MAGRRRPAQLPITGGDLDAQHTAAREAADRERAAIIQQAADAAVKRGGRNARKE